WDTYLLDLDAAETAWVQAEEQAWNTYDAAMQAASDAWDLAEQAAWDAYDGAVGAATDAWNQAEAAAAQTYDGAIQAADAAWTAAEDSAWSAYQSALNAAETTWYNTESQAAATYDAAVDAAFAAWTAAEQAAWDAYEDAIDALNAADPQNPVTTESPRTPSVVPEDNDNDILVIYDSKDKLTKHFVEAADDYPNSVGADNWANLIAQLDAFVRKNGLVDQLHIWDHGFVNTHQQTFGPAQAVTSDQLAQLAPYLSNDA